MKRLFFIALVLFTLPSFINLEAEAKNYPSMTYNLKCIAMGSDTTPDYDLNYGTGANCYTDTIDTGATTVTFSNPAPSGLQSNLVIKLTNGGSQTITWPTSVDWAGGTAPTLTAAGIDWIDCSTIDGGTVWYCFTSGLDLK